MRHFQFLHIPGLKLKLAGFWHRWKLLKAFQPLCHKFLCSHKNKKIIQTLCAYMAKLVVEYNEAIELVLTTRFPLTLKRVFPQFERLYLR